MQDMKDQVVVITGGTSGFGKATAARMLAEGAHVVITGSDQGRLTAAAAELGGVDPQCGDVTRWEDWQRLFDAVMARYGRVDVLVNNAGSGVRIAPTVEQTVGEVDYSVALNFTGVIYGCMLFGKQMMAQGKGTIINISSACAHEAWPGFSVYAGAKAGMAEFSKGLYTELRPHGVRVTVVQPGAGDTRWSSNSGLGDPAVPYALKAEDMAEVILHVCRMPPHIEIEEYRFWGTDQEVIPL